MILLSSSFITASSILSLLAKALSTLQVGVTVYWLLFEGCWLVVFLRLQVESRLLKAPMLMVEVTRRFLMGCWLEVAFMLPLVSKLPEPTKQVVVGVSSSLWFKGC